MFSRARVLLPILMFGIYGIYYYFSNRETAPLTGRSHIRMSKNSDEQY